MKTPSARQFFSAEMGFRCLQILMQSTSVLLWFSSVVDGYKLLYYLSLSATNTYSWQNCKFKVILWSMSPRLFWPPLPISLCVHVKFSVSMRFELLSEALTLLILFLIFVHLLLHVITVPATTMWKMNVSFI